jgi:lipopolysaccharide/colanic/teichoic acid biosynthesis glycosyltransferase
MEFNFLKLVNPSSAGHDICDELFRTESEFHRLLYVEQKRSERSRRPFILMLLDVTGHNDNPRRGQILLTIKGVLSDCLRDTDMRGWYRTDSLIGIIFTEIQILNENVKKGLLRKIHAKLNLSMGPDDLKKIRIFLHVYPEEIDENGKTNGLSNVFNPKPSPPKASGKHNDLVKRCIDLSGSIAALMIFSPVFITIAVAVKMTSKGPVIFRQSRIGMHGKPFIFLKFRSMYIDRDENPHIDYIKKFINGRPAETGEAGKENDIYKLTKDPRITPVGRFIRKTSLDELPQFINVLKGEMSLVGPRPPLPYEFELYDTWHKRRLRQVKPGITGLWQVHGRSSTTFDDMVRLDLKYVAERSLWLDIKILLKTPSAVISCKGAY